MIDLDTFSRRGGLYMRDDVCMMVSGEEFQRHGTIAPYQNISYAFANLLETGWRENIQRKNAVEPSVGIIVEVSGNGQRHPSSKEQNTKLVRIQKKKKKNKDIWLQT